MSLTSVAAPIWNEIAKTQTLKTAWAKKAFAMTAEEMTDLENKEFASLTKTTPANVASAYLDASGPPGGQLDRHSRSGLYGGTAGRSRRRTRSQYQEPHQIPQGHADCCAELEQSMECEGQGLQVRRVQRPMGLDHGLGDERAPAHRTRTTVGWPPGRRVSSTWHRPPADPRTNVHPSRRVHRAPRCL